MTKVSVDEYYDSRVVRIEGHSGYAALGSDIVCAAISAVAYTLLNALRQAESDGDLFIRDESAENGNMFIDVEPYSFSKEKVDTIIETCMAGFSAIEEEFPDYIEILS